MTSRIARAFDMMFGQACSHATSRVEAAYADFDRSASKLTRVALDVMSESADPVAPIGPYSEDKIAAAIADVTRRYREAHRRGS